MPAAESAQRKTVLITGSATGVGKACAVRFAQLGFDVAINYSRSAAEAEETAGIVRALGAKTLCIQCDVSQESQVVQMMEQIEAEFGQLDVLVNNAAMTYFIPAQKLADMTEEKWDRILSVNTKGPFFCIKAAEKLLRHDRGGAIVNVSSVAGNTGRGSCIAYAASKAALNTMTKTLAIALAPDIRVNAVLPGPIDSRWIRDGANDWDLDDLTASYPIPRASTPDEIADGIVFLATGTAMTTGQLVAIDGGHSLI